MERDQILKEIRRTAAANNGVPLGRARFEAETGIRESAWSGRYWVRWNDALVEAGFQPNAFGRERLADDDVLESLVSEIRRLGRMPTQPELRMRRREDRAFPSPGVFERFGSKSALARRVADFCGTREEYQDVLV